MTSFLGIDVSKATLESVLLEGCGSTKRYACGNDQEGHRQLADLALSSGAAVCVEATGAHHMALCRELAASGVSVTVLNPKQARDLAKGLGLLHKTDRADALVLARAASMLRPEPSRQRSQAHDELRQISRLIQAFTEERSDSKKRLSNPMCDLARESLERHIAFLGNEIRLLEKQWDQALKRSPGLSRNYELTLSVWGIGPKSARVIVSELPEDLSDLTPRQIASYAGLVPRQDSSGKRQGRASIGQSGNSRLRKSVFMPATLAAFRDQEMKDIYQSLLARGRTHMQAITALMHKLLRQVAAVLKRGSHWVAANPAIDNT